MTEEGRIDGRKEGRVEGRRMGSMPYNMKCIPSRHAFGKVTLFSHLEQTECLYIAYICLKFSILRYSPFDVYNRITHIDAPSFLAEFDLPIDAAFQCARVYTSSRHLNRVHDPGELVVISGELKSQKGTPVGNK